jgi:hypothetical protein
MNDIHPAGSDISGKTQLIQNTAVAIKATPCGVEVHGDFGAQTLEQWSSPVQTGDFHIEPRRIQAVGNMNELTLRASDVEMIQKLQKFDSISVHRITCSTTLMPRLPAV